MSVFYFVLSDEDMKLIESLSRPWRALIPVKEVSGTAPSSPDSFPSFQSLPPIFFPTLLSHPLSHLASSSYTDSQKNFAGRGGAAYHAACQTTGCSLTQASQSEVLISVHQKYLPISPRKAL